MLKKPMGLILVAVSFSTGIAHAADTTASANATWRAVAKKDTTSKLVVTSLGGLNFNYAEGTKKFNTETGLFDITISGDTSAKGFKLTSKLINNTLAQPTTASTLFVGVDYNGSAITKETETIIFNTDTKLDPASHLHVFSTTYNKSGRTSSQDLFTFSITGGTDANGEEIKDYTKLPEGLWSGDVTVQFTATWTS